MVCNRIAVQTCLSLLIAVGTTRASDSEPQDRTHNPGVEIWLGTNRITPPRPSELPTPRLIEPVMTDQAVLLRSRSPDVLKRREEAVQSLPAGSNVPWTVVPERDGDQSVRSNSSSDAIPVWRLPTRPGSSGVETTLSETAAEPATPSFTLQDIAAPGTDGLLNVESSESIGEALRLLNGSIELNQRAASILKSLSEDRTRVNSLGEQSGERTLMTSPVPEEADPATKPEETEGMIENSLRIRGNEAASQLLGLCPSALERLGFGQIALLVVVVLVTVTISRDTRQVRRSRSS